MIVRSLYLFYGKGEMASIEGREECNGGHFVWIIFVKYRSIFTIKIYYTLGGSFWIRQSTLPPSALLTTWASYDQGRLADAEKTISRALAKKEKALSSFRTVSMQSRKCSLSAPVGVEHTTTSMLRISTEQKSLTVLWLRMQSTLPPFESRLSFKTHCDL